MKFVNTGALRGGGGGGVLTFTHTFLGQEGLKNDFEDFWKPWTAPYVAAGAFFFSEK